MPETESSPSETLARALGVVTRRRWLILSSAVATALTTVAVVYQLPNRYTSEATLLVVQQQVPLRYVTPTTTTDVADALQAMTQEVLSRTQLLELIDQFGLFTKERLRLAPEELIALMRKYIEIHPLDPTVGHKEFSAFKISFTADKAILAQDVTSRLTSLFIQANLKTREDQATNTTSFLQEHLDAAKKKLTEQEERKRDFKMQYLGELPEQEQGNLAILGGAQLQLQNIAASLDRAQQQRVYLDSLLGGYRRVASRGAPLRSDGSRTVTPLESAQGDLDRLQSERAKLVRDYKPIHPDVVSIEREIAAKQAQVESLKTMKALQPASPDVTPTAAVTPGGAEEEGSIAQVKSQLESNRLEIENLSKDEKRLKEVISQYQNRLNITPVREQQLAEILRDYELSKQDYSDLLGKEQQSQLAMSLEKHQGGQQFRLVDPPSRPALPSSPNRLKVSLGGVGGGVLLGLALAFLTEFRNLSFHSEKEVKERLSPPLLVVLPLLFTSAEQRRRNWKKTFEWFSGTILAAAVFIAEFYVYRHP
jgi:polysaccharide chain length determinant protein (PEP-CTERM system associated)